MKGKGGPSFLSVKGQSHILVDSQIIKDPNEWKGPDDAGSHPFFRGIFGDIISLIKDHAFIGNIKSGEKIQKGGFPGTVGTDDADRLIPIDDKINLVNRDKITE